MLTLSALYRCGTHFDKIGQIGLKSALVEHWLATFTVTRKPGHSYWASSNYTCIVLLRAFVRYQHTSFTKPSRWDRGFFSVQQCQW